MNTEFYEGLFLTMERSGQDFRSKQEKLEDAWQDLQAVPSYVERHAPAEQHEKYDELDEYGTHAPNCRCAWCEPQY